MTNSKNTRTSNTFSSRMRWYAWENSRVEETEHSSEAMNMDSMFSAVIDNRTTAIKAMERMLEESNDFFLVRNSDGEITRELKRRDPESVAYRSTESEYERLLKKTIRRMDEITRVGKDKHALYKMAGTRGFNTEKRVNQILEALRAEYRELKRAKEMLELIISAGENNFFFDTSVSVEEVDPMTPEYDEDEELWNAPAGGFGEAQMDVVWNTESEGIFDDEGNFIETERKEVDAGYWFPAPYRHARMPKVYQWYAKRIESGEIDSPKWLFEKLAMTKTKYRVEESTHRRWSVRLWSLFHSKAFRTNPGWYKKWIERKRAYKMRARK
jgi:hypothetical protein